MKARITQYLDRCSSSEWEASVEHHIETRRAIAELFDLAVLVTLVGGIAALLVWQERQTVAGQGQDNGETEAGKQEPPMNT
jgi:hypothetical protein